MQIKSCMRAETVDKLLDWKLIYCLHWLHLTLHTNVYPSCFSLHPSGLHLNDTLKGLGHQMDWDIFLYVWIANGLNNRRGWILKCLQRLSIEINLFLPVNANISLLIMLLAQSFCSGNLSTFSKAELSSEFPLRCCQCCWNNFAACWSTVDLGWLNIGQLHVPAGVLFFSLTPQFANLTPTWYHINTDQ
jgi:hypothetical protein